MNGGMESGKQPAPVRVHLQVPAPVHGPEFLAAVAASRSLHRPWVSPPATRAAYRAHVARCKGDDFRSLLIRRNFDDALVGLANLSAIQRGNLQSAYLGFYAFVPYTGGELDKVFSKHHERVVGNDNVVSIGRLKLQIERQPFRFSMAKCRVLVCEHRDGTMVVYYGPHLLGRYDAAGSPLTCTAQKSTQAA